jgi:hypothetical protein
MSELTPAQIEEIRRYYDELGLAAVEVLEALEAASAQTDFDQASFHAAQQRAEQIMRAILAMQDR